jgi:hypothetical protein
MYGYKLPVTDASKANKQYTQNVWLHLNNRDEIAGLFLWEMI